MLTSSPDRPGAPPAGCSTRSATSIRTRWAAIRSVRAASQYPTNALEASTRKTATTTASQRRSAPVSRLTTARSITQPTVTGTAASASWCTDTRNAATPSSRGLAAAARRSTPRGVPGLRDTEAPLTCDAG